MEYYQALAGQASFNKADLLQVYQAHGEEISEVTLRKKIKVLLDQGAILRVGRNRYCVTPEGVGQYHYRYSSLACAVAACVESAYPYIAFTVFELVQINEFVNHQIAHNVIFLSVEEEAAPFVFDTLKQVYAGKVLFKPSVALYHQYWCDDMIVIGKLVTEAPKSHRCPWHTRIEKMLVDLCSDVCCAALIAPGEYATILSDAFARYAIDESCLFRYAKRRGVVQKMKALIQTQAQVNLRTEVQHDL